MTTYAFTVEQVDYYPEREGQNNVIQLVNWRLTGTDGVRTASVAGATYIPFNPEATFHPLEQLSQDEVISWVRAELAKGAAASDRRGDKPAALSEADYERMVGELLAAQSQPEWVGT